MAQLKQIKVNGQTIAVEVLEAALPAENSSGLERHSGSSASIPEDAGPQIEATLSAVSESVQNSFKACVPDEWSIEVGMGFEAKGGLVLMSGKATGSLKVKATWKKPAQP